MPDLWTIYLDFWTHPLSWLVLGSVVLVGALAYAMDRWF